MKAAKFAKCAENIAKKYKTLYVMGCFGAPLNSANKKRYTNNHAYNKNPERTELINAATDKTFGFDCVGLIKGILWGWNGNARKTYGGAVYCSGGVPDTDADTLLRMCKEISADFKNIAVGEVVWTDGHIGIYIGNGLAVECTPAFNDRVQITAVKNIGIKKGYNQRTWKKHGKLPFVTYPATGKKPKNTETKKSVAAFRIGDKVSVNGKIYYFGNGGTSIKKKNETMYVVDIVNKSNYKYYIGVAAAANGVRQGWASPDILTAK